RQCAWFSFSGIHDCRLLRSSIVCSRNFRRISRTYALSEHGKAVLCGSRNTSDRARRRRNRGRGQFWKNRSLMKIRFNRPYVTGKEAGYIQDVIERGHASGDGLYTKKCHQILETLLTGSRVLLTTSCTHALEMAAILLDIKPGDQVIVPS